MVLCRSWKSVVIRTRLLDMAKAPFGVIISIRIDGAYEDDLVPYPYSVLGTAEESPGCWSGLTTVIISYDCNWDYPTIYNLRCDRGFTGIFLNCNWKENGCSEVGRQKMLVSLVTWQYHTYYLGYQINQIGGICPWQTGSWPAPSAGLTTSVRQSTGDPSVRGWWIWLQTA